MRFLRNIALLCVLLSVSIAAAQDPICTEIVDRALTAVQDACASTARNQACYGYVSIQAVPRFGTLEFAFDTQGDVANVVDIESMRLRPYDPVDKTWGVSLMQIQADLPDALPGQNVTMLLFGDTEITNAVEPGAPTVTAVAGSGVNIRTSPSTEGRVAGSLVEGETVTANGRNAAGDWLRIRVPDSDALGWVFAGVFTITGDVNTLEIVDSLASETTFTPMQAFYFRTGALGAIDCNEAPDGLLVQTPQGVGQINLRANDVGVRLGSTAFMQALPGDSMVVSVIEGTGEVTAQGRTVAVPAGSSVTIPLGIDSRAAGTPSDPVSYNEADFSGLPLSLLPRTVTVAPPADAEVIAAAVGQSGGGSAGAITIPLQGEPIDFGVYANLTDAEFCAAFSRALPLLGNDRNAYIQYVRIAILALSPIEQGQAQAFIARLEACPS